MAERSPIITGIPEGTPGYSPGHGYTLLMCSCGGRFWIGPRSLALHRQGIEAMCFPCAIARHGPPATITPLTSEDTGATFDPEEFRRKS